MKLIYCSLHVYKFGLLIYVVLDSTFTYVLRLKLLKFIGSIQQMSFSLYNSKRQSSENCFVTEICSILWFPSENIVFLECTFIIRFWWSIFEQTPSNRCNLFRNSPSSTNSIWISWLLYFLVPVTIFELIQQATLRNFMFLKILLKKLISPCPDCYCYLKIA